MVGECDGGVVAELREAIMERLENVRTAVVDLSAVTFIGSAGLGVLAAAQRHSDVRGTSLIVRDPSPIVARMLEIAGLADHLDVRTGS